MSGETAEDSNEISLREETETDNLLNTTYGSNIQIPVVVEKFPTCRYKKSKIELLGENVMQHLTELAKTTELSYEQMARRINETYHLVDSQRLTSSNVREFFQANVAVIKALMEENKSLEKLRAEIFLDASKVLITDIRTLDSQIDAVLNDDMLESDKRAKAISDLIDKKGRLLLRHGTLSGKLKEMKEQNTPAVKGDTINIFQQINIEKSELINRLKKAEFTESNIIDVQNANKKTNTKRLSNPN